jgi:tetratricopeptide (TPR) repeat protein
MNYFLRKLNFLPQIEQTEILPLRYAQGFGSLAQNDRRVKNYNFFSVSSVAKLVFVLFFILCILIIDCFAIARNDNIVYAAEMDYFAEGMKQLQMENYEEAEPLLLKAYQKELTNPNITYSLGVLYNAMENFSESLKFFKKTVRINPNLLEVRYYLAQVLMMTGDYDGALEQFEEADKVRHISMITYYKGMIYNQKGDYKRAIELIKTAGEEDKNLQPTVQYQLGVINYNNGNFNEAKAYFRSLISLHPKSDEAEFARQYLAAIEQIESMRNYKITLGYSYQYDDNVVLKPVDASAAEGVTNKSDWVSNLNFGFDYSKSFTNRGNIGIGYNFSQSLHALFTNYDIQSHAVNILPAYNFGSINTTLMYSYSYLYLDRTGYMQSNAVSPIFSYMLSGGRQMAQVSFKWQDKKYIKSPSSADEDRTGANYDGGAAYFLFFKEGKGYINFKYNYDRDSTNGNNWKYNGHKGAASILLPVSDKVNFSLSGDGYKQIYDNTHSTYGIKRDDTTYNANTLISINLFKNLKSDITYTYTRAFSNTTVYDYVKNSVSIGLNYVW